jgi:hypothetical protein
MAMWQKLNRYYPFRLEIIPGVGIFSGMAEYPLDCRA